MKKIYQTITIERTHQKKCWRLLFFLSYSFLATLPRITGQVNQLMLGVMAGVQYPAYPSTDNTSFATAVPLGQTNDVWGDTNGNLYILEGGANRVSKVTPTGIISSVAGIGTNGEGFNADGLPATSSEFDNPNQLWLDTNGNIFIADTWNNRIRKVSATTGIMTTVAGNHDSGYTPPNDGIKAINATLNDPQGIWGDTSGNLYIADQNNERIRKVATGSNIISTIIGNGTAGYNGENIPGTLTMVHSPSGLSGDSNGNLFYSDSSNNRVRKLSSEALVSTVVGGGSNYGQNILATLARLNNPSDVFVDTSQNLYIADTGNCRILKVTASTNILTVIVNTARNCYPITGDGGFANNSAVSAVQGIWLNSNGILFVPDKANRRVRMISTNNIITTYAGNSLIGDGGPASNAILYNPLGMTGDSNGNIYVTDSCTIRKISAVTNIIQTIAGAFVCSDTDDGQPASTAYIDTPKSIALDSIGNIYMTNGAPRVRFITIATNIINTLAGGGSSTFSSSTENSTGTSVKFVYLQGIWVDIAGNVYFCDNTLYRIIKYTSVTKRVTTLAGTGTPGYSGDGGPASSAELKNPLQIVGNNQGQIFLADSGKIRMITLSNPAMISTIAGTGVYSAYNAPYCAIAAELNNINSLALDSLGNLYLNDASTRVRQLTPTANASCWEYNVLFGNGRTSSVLTAPTFALSAISLSDSIWMSENGTFYILEQNFHRIRSSFYVSAPTGQPTRQPTSHPTKRPTRAPTSRPSRSPSSKPSKRPSSQPTSRPSRSPSSKPSKRPSSQPTSRPSRSLSSKPSGGPSSQPTSRPSRSPSSKPSGGPSSQPTSRPSRSPSSRPSRQPSGQPTSQPSRAPSAHPSGQPTTKPLSLPSAHPTCLPTSQPTMSPTQSPTSQPTSHPTKAPTGQPTKHPSSQPTSLPSNIPTSQPTRHHSSQPTSKPSHFPTNQPTKRPSSHPTNFPSSQPTNHPSCRPSSRPTTVLLNPTSHPTAWPSKSPSVRPSEVPSSQPTQKPTTLPTRHPLSRPSAVPTRSPSEQPIVFPSGQPTSYPSRRPTEQPSGQPSSGPSGQPTEYPSTQPTSRPSKLSTANPSARPTTEPSAAPSGLPSDHPSSQPSSHPSSVPSCFPSFQQTTAILSEVPSSQPSVPPSTEPTSTPTCNPTSPPTIHPSSHPSSYPSTQTSTSITGEPTAEPTSSLSTFPSQIPSAKPSSISTDTPTHQPSPGSVPTENPSTQSSWIPSSQPSSRPSSNPSAQPFSSPSSFPSSHPSGMPSISPSKSLQTSHPTTRYPTVTPTILPSISPSAFPTYNRLDNNGTLPITSPFYINLLNNDQFQVSIFLFSLIKVANVGFLNLSTTGLEEEGCSYVVFGKKGGYSNITMDLLSSEGRDVEFAQLLSSGLACESASMAVSLLGDINRDGYEDVGIGSPFNDEVYVLFGSRESTGLFHDGFTLYGENTGDYFGWSIAGAGDFNQDGYDDIIIGAILRNVIYLIYGKGKGFKNLYMTQLLAEEGLKILGSSSSSTNLLGVAVSGAGDFNGDGTDDVMFSSIGLLGADTIYIIYGQSFFQPNVSIDLTQFNSSQKSEIIFPTTNSFAGLSLASVGDINVDGYDDVVIGSVPYKAGYTTQVSYVVFGGNQSFIQIGMNMSEGEGLRIIGGGFLVGGPGDVDGDGIADVVITSYQNWPDQVGDYILQMPLKYSISKRPTQMPTSNPTKLTNQPSNHPSSQPTEIEPLLTPPPSFAPSGPTVFPSLAPSNPTSMPSSAPTTEYSRRPTTIRPSIRTRSPSIPKTSKPTASPSFIPSLIPTRSPTIFPSLKPTTSPTILPSRVPSMKPTALPSHHPTINLHPTSTPSISPTISFYQPFVTYFINEAGNISINSSSSSSSSSTSGQSKQGPRQFIITSDVDISLNSSRFSRTIYTVLSRSNVTITINKFQLKEDIIDFSHYFPPTITNLNELSYSTSPLTLLLAHHQLIVFPDITNFDLTERNFFWGSSTNSNDDDGGNNAAADTSSTTHSILATNVITTIGVLGGLLFVSTCFFQFRDYIELLFQESRAIKQLSRRFPPLQEKQGKGGGGGGSSHSSSDSNYSARRDESSGRSDQISNERERSTDDDDDDDDDDDYDDISFEFEIDDEEEEEEEEAEAEITYIASSTSIPPATTNKEKLILTNYHHQSHHRNKPFHDGLTLTRQNNIIPKHTASSRMRENAAKKKKKMKQNPREDLQEPSIRIGQYFRDLSAVVDESASSSVGTSSHSSYSSNREGEDDEMTTMHPMDNSDSFSSSLPSSFYDV